MFGSEGSRTPAKETDSLLLYKVAGILEPEEAMRRGFEKIWNDLCKKGILVEDDPANPEPNPFRRRD